MAPVRLTEEELAQYRQMGYDKFLELACDPKIRERPRPSLLRMVMPRDIANNTQKRLAYMRGWKNCDDELFPSMN